MPVHSVSLHSPCTLVQPAQVSSPTPALMTRKEYAAHRGCSVRTVYKAHARGQVVVDEATGRIDVAQTDARWPHDRAAVRPEAQGMLGLPQEGAPPLQPSPGRPARRADRDVGWLTVSEYAEHRKKRGWAGGSTAAVHKAIAAGRIGAETRYSNRHGKAVRLIDATQADVDWVANTTRPAQLPQGDGGQLAEPADPKRPGPRTSSVKAEIDELKRDELARVHETNAKLLVRKADLRTDLVEATLRMRRGVEAVPRDIAPRIARESDVSTCRVLLVDALNRLLNAWSDDLASVLATD